MADVPSAANDPAPPGEALADSLADLYDEAPCGYLTSLPDGRIVRVNQTFLRWTGYRREQVLGRRLRDLVTAGGRIYYETHYAPLLRMQGEVRGIAFDLVGADQRRIPILLNSVVRADAAGQPAAVRTTVFDATDRRRYEAELLAARLAAEESEERIRLLQQTVADLAAAATAAAAARVIVHVPAAAFAAASASVWLVDRDRLALAAVSGVGERLAPADDAWVSLSDDVPLTEVVRAGDLRILDPSQVGERDRCWLGTWAPAGAWKTMVLAPLTADSQVLGVLAFVSEGPPGLVDTQLRLLRLLGHQAGQALDRARLYDASRQREARSSFLAATIRAMDEVREPVLRSQRLVDQLVPEFAAGAAVRMGGPRGAPLASAGVGPAVEPEEVTRLVAEVFSVGRARLRPGAHDRDAWAVLPLAARGAVVGTLMLRFPAGRRLHASDLSFLTALADRAGLSLENARLAEQEREVAQTLQRSLLAGEPPRDGRFSVAAHYRPATEGLEVGGDWHDTFLITTDKLSIVVGDVVGRGIRAASAMGQLRSAIRALAAAELGPARLVERLDRFVEGLEAARMATLAYGELSLSTGELTYCCAGHLPPLLQAGAEEPTYLWGGRSAPLGSRAGRTARTEARVVLPPGARLLLYTDGLIERRTRVLDDGFAALADELARRRESPLATLAGDLADVLVGDQHDDDVCLLCLSFGGETRLERAITADVHQIAPLRQDLRGWLAANSVDRDSREAVLLACSEAVANAIEHGYRHDPAGTVAVVATLAHDTVELSVRDTGRWRPQTPDPARGRGLFLIRELMDEVTVERGPDRGTVVTMRRRTAGKAA